MISCLQVSLFFRSLLSPFCRFISASAARMSTPFLVAFPSVSFLLFFFLPFLTLPLCLRSPDFFVFCLSALCTSVLSSLSPSFLSSFSLSLHSSLSASCFSPNFLFRLLSSSSGVSRSPSVYRCLRVGLP
ncbi:hypothetical protein TGARI_228280B [Toxoplasma gondii ARI]|uniref:Transmembrane protein n=1 Tax=Toxoplasma gondii ARI TaxID=1074872 RepID=A0A139XXF5_TOXGO|nr:hypothetical protein TGARI_228280B [Toxoplasma gondii ARI]